MPDKFEYEAVIGDRTEIVPEGRTPGRGLIKAPLPVEFQVALCVREEAGLSWLRPCAAALPKALPLPARA
jgi:S-DNA-T family DNA segregation ATPase FtsK/SpoIIIE